MAQQRSRSIFRDDMDKPDRPSLLAVMQDLFSFDSGSPINKRTAQKAQLQQQQQEQQSYRASLVSVEEHPLSFEPVQEEEQSTGEDVVDISASVVTLDPAKEQLLKQHITGEDLHGAVSFSVDVDIGQHPRLGLVVAQLEGVLWYVSSAKRENDELLPGEAAGIRVGDIILGIDFKSCRAGSSNLTDEIVRIKGEKREAITMQVLRFTDVCSQSAPGRLLAKRVAAYTFKALHLHKKQALQYGEIWRFMDEVLLFGQQMLARDKTNKRYGGPMFDQERIIMRVKGLRSALDVRCIHSIVTDDTVEYILRVEDVESGLQWQIRRRYREFYELHQQLLEECPALEDVPFPGKRLPAMRRNAKLVEERIGALEYFLRQCIHGTALFATIRPNCARALHIIQAFLFVSKHLSPSNPPALDDQRSVEVLAHRLLNDTTSPACLFAIKYLMKADLDAQVANEPHGYRPMLQHVAAALNELQQFMMQMHSQQMFDLLKARDARMSADQAQIFVRRCVRRQVEAALYLPLRRTIIRIVQSFLSNEIRELQQSMRFLRQRPPSEFGVLEELVVAPSWNRTLQLFQDITRAFLPADQGNMLKRSSVAVMRLHSEAMQIARDKRVSMQEPASAELPRVQDLTVDPDPSSDTLSTTNSGTDDSELIGNLEETQRSPDIPDPGDSSMQNSGALMSELAARGVTTEQLDGLAKRRSMRFPTASAVEKPALAKTESTASETSKLMSLADKLMQSLRGAPSEQPSDSDSEQACDQPDVCPEHPNSFDEKEGANPKKYNLDVGDPFTNARSTKGERSSIAESHSSLLVSEHDFGSLAEPISPSAFEDNSDDEQTDPSATMSPRTNGTHSGDHSCQNDSSSHSSGDAGSAAAAATAVEQPSVLAADDFLPMFTFILFHASPTYLLLIKELMVYLVDEEEAFGEYGYYLATLEAAVQHIQDMYKEKTSETQLEAV